MAPHQGEHAKHVGGAGDHAGGPDRGGQGAALLDQLGRVPPGAVLDPGQEPGEVQGLGQRLVVPGLAHDRGRLDGKVRHAVGEVAAAHVHRGGGEQGAGGQQMLAVVQDDQQPLLGQLPSQRDLGRPVSGSGTSSTDARSAAPARDARATPARRRGRRRDSCRPA
jgi:hypothetical protein